MNILIACEESQTVCTAFRKKGHEAFSADLLPTIGKHEWHFQGDVTNIMSKNFRKWDIIIAFPPCTDLAVSGARWFPEKRANGTQQKSIDFFMLFANHSCKKIAIENPIGIMSTVYRKPDQIIQPYNFGHDASKKTCLWLKGLPRLNGTEYIEPRIIDGKKRWANQTDSGQNKLTPSETRAEERSKTYQGIADAMAEQWG